MRYVEKHLRLNEHPVDKAKVSWTVTAAVIIRAVVILLIGYGIWNGMKDPIELNIPEITASLPPEVTGSLNPDLTNIIISLKKPSLLSFMGGWGVLTLLQLVYRILSISAVELLVTDKKIVGKTGIIKSVSVDAFLDKIDYFMIRESLWGRIFNYAVIEIGTTSSKVRFPYITNASEFKNIVMDCIDKKKLADMTAQANLIASSMETRQQPRPEQSGNAVPARLQPPEMPR